MPQLATKPRIQLTKIDHIAFDPEQATYNTPSSRRGQNAESSGAPV
jgi:hypothetical protein